MICNLNLLTPLRQQRTRILLQNSMSFNHPLDTGLNNIFKEGFRQTTETSEKDNKDVWERGGLDISPRKRIWRSRHVWSWEKQQQKRHKRAFFRRLKRCHTEEGQCLFSLDTACMTQNNGLKVSRGKFWFNVFFFKKNKPFLIVKEVMSLLSLEMFHQRQDKHLPGIVWIPVLSRDCLNDLISRSNYISKE